MMISSEMRHKSDCGGGADKYSTLVELSHAANSLKSLFKIRAQREILLTQNFNRVQPFLRRAREPIRSVVLRPLQRGTGDDFLHPPMIAQHSVSSARPRPCHSRSTTRRANAGAMSPMRERRL